MNQIKLAGYLFTAGRIFIFVIVLLCVMSMLVYVYFKYLSYPLFQLIVSWQDSTLILQIAGETLLGIWITHRITNIFWGKGLVLETQQQELKIQSGIQRLSVPFRQIKRISYAHQNNLLNRITVIGPKTYYIQVGTLFKGLPSETLQPFIKNLNDVLLSDYSYNQKLVKTPHNKVVNEVHHIHAPDYDLDKKVKRKRIGIAAGITVWLAVVGLLVYILMLGDGLMINGEDYGNSQYEQYENKVYYLEIGDGYFEVEGADAKHFQPYVFGNEHGTEMGRDNNHVYSGVNKIAGIDVDKSIYLGKNYIRDDHNVFYKTTGIKGADARSFHSVATDYNTVKFTYATDTQHVYYREHVLDKLNPRQIRLFDGVLDHIADSSYIYFENILLHGLKGSVAYVERIDNQLSYATDDRALHFINGIALPATVSDNIIGFRKTNAAHMRLLLKKSSGSAHMIFHDGKGIFYFDEAKQQYFHVKNLSGQFRKLDDRIFTDGQSIYFTERRRLGTRRRSGSLNVIGVQTRLYKLKDVSAKDFKWIRKGDKFNVFTDGKQQYISVHDYGNRVSILSSLYVLHNDAVQTSSEIRSDDIRLITHKEQVLHINSRNNYNQIKIPFVDY